MWWYRLLLHFYPASFRIEYGDEMTALYRGKRRAAGGAPAHLWLAVQATFDVLPNAARLHADVLGGDLRYTARTLRRSWGFTLTTVFIVALGVGANTAAFSVADYVLVRPLPFPRPDRLISVWENTPGYPQMEVSPPNLLDWREMNRSFAALGAFTGAAANLVVDGDPVRIEGVSVTPDLLPLIGTPPLLGRLPTGAAVAAGEKRSLVLSYALWRGRFGGAPGIIGRQLNLDGSPYVVVAVMPRDYYFPSRDVQYWEPLDLTEPRYADRTDNELDVVGRLRDGVSLEQARADLVRVAAQLEQMHPVENERTGVSLDPYGQGMSEQSKDLLLALCGAAICILLLACANLANLLLARAAARERELAVRTALGAGRERLVRQMATESIVLALAGGAAGVLVAIASVPLLATLVPRGLPIASQPTVDVRVLALAGLFTAITGLGFGLIPAWRAGGAAAFRALREGARAGARGQRVRSVLVTVQITASVVLVVASGLLIRAMWRVQQVDPGFHAEGVLTLQTALPLNVYSDADKRETFYRRVLDGVTAMPGVTRAAYISGLPMVRRGGIWPVSLNGPLSVRDAANIATLRFVTPGYFHTLDVPLRAGRDVAETDRLDHPMVAVVSESFVRRYWPGESALGRRFNFAYKDREIVGVVGDVRVRGLEQSSEPQVYLPYTQMGNTLLGYAPVALAIRSTVPSASLVAAVRRVVHDADPAQPISDVRPLERVVTEQTASRAAQLRILGALALVALLLAAVGIHGLLSFAVARRAPEIGVRLALGAKPRSIMRMVVREGLLLTAAGLVPGLLLAYAAGRSMSALLFGVQPADVPTWTVAVVTAIGMTLLGSVLPALRAVRTDPLTVMRSE